MVGLEKRLGLYRLTSINLINARQDPFPVARRMNASTSRVPRAIIHSTRMTTLRPVGHDDVTFGQIDGAALEQGSLLLPGLPVDERHALPCRRLSNRYAQLSEKNW